MLSPPLWTGWIIDTMVCWNHPPFLSNSFLASQQSLSLFYAFGHRYHRWAPLSLSAYVLSPLCLAGNTMPSRHTSPYPAHNYFAEQLNSICAWWWTALTTILVAGIKDESFSSSSRKNGFWNLPLMPIAYNKTTCDSYDIHKSCLSLNLCSGRLILSGLSNLISYLVISQSLSHNDTMSAYNLLSWHNLSLHSSWCSTKLVLD